MPKLIAWFVDNPVAANLLMFILIASGLLALNDVRKEEFPKCRSARRHGHCPLLGCGTSRG